MQAEIQNKAYEKRLAVERGEDNCSVNKYQSAVERLSTYSRWTRSGELQVERLKN